MKIVNDKGDIMQIQQNLKEHFRILVPKYSMFENIEGLGMIIEGCFKANEFFASGTGINQIRGVLY